VDVAIETPKYFIVGKPAMIKFKLIGDKSKSVEGKATINYDRDGAEIKSEIMLTADRPELMIEYTPKPYYESPYAQVKFDGRSTENMEIHSDSLKPLLDPKLSLGSSNTIKSGTSKRLDLTYSTAFEQAIETNVHFTWTQTQGPQVNLKPTSGNSVEFSAPIVTENTVLTFAADYTYYDKNLQSLISVQGEKTVHIIPDNSWVKILKSFDGGAALVREDNTVLFDFADDTFERYTLTKPLESIKDMLVIRKYSALILYRDGTVDVIVFNGGPKLPYAESPKTTVKPGTLNKAGSFYTANNIVGIGHYGEYAWVAAVKWEPGVTAPSIFVLGGDPEQTASPAQLVPTYTLNENGVLSGWIGYNFNFIPFTVNDATTIGDNFHLNVPNPSGKTIAFISKANEPELLTVKPVNEANPLEDRLGRTALPKSPLQSSEFVAIHLKRQKEANEIFLVEKNGLVTLYDGAWKTVPFLEAMQDLGNPSITKDGTALVWNWGAPPSNQSDSSTRTTPHPYNIR
jgi:hypothetical protein